MAADTLQSLARHAVINAKARGALVPQPCKMCGSGENVHAHHHNGYDPAHWLDVEWLCRWCHVDAHLGTDRRPPPRPIDDPESAGYLAVVLCFTERRLILDALIRAKGNRSRAAKDMDITRRQLHRRFVELFTWEELRRLDRDAWGDAAKDAVERIATELRDYQSAAKAARAAA